MTTCHDALPETVDEQVLVDIDLSILGADAARFDEYEVQVRAEYRWVPDFVFRPKRREVLEEFLARPTLYSTERFQTLLEKKSARESRALFIQAPLISSRQPCSRAPRCRPSAPDRGGCA